MELCDPHTRYKISSEHYSAGFEDMSFLPYRPAEPTTPRALRKAFPGQGLITYKPDSKRRSYTNFVVAASLSKNGDDSGNSERTVSVKPEPMDLPLIWIGSDITHKIVAGVKGSNCRGRRRRPSPKPPGAHIKWRLKLEENPRRSSISLQCNLKDVSIPRRARSPSQQKDTDIRVPKVEEDEEEMRLSPWDLITSGPLPEARCELRGPSDRVTAAAKRKRAVRKLIQDAHNRNRIEADDDVRLARAEALQNMEMPCPQTDTTDECQVGELQYPYAKVTAANGFIVKAEPVECKVPPRRSFFDVVLNPCPN